MQRAQFFSEFIVGGKTVTVPEEPLDLDEQQKLETRRQKQAAHSARVVYVLQLQVGLGDIHVDGPVSVNLTQCLFLKGE